MRLRVYFQEPVLTVTVILFYCGLYRDVRFVVTFLFEDYLSVYQGKESMIPAYSDVITRVVCCAALANDYAAGLNCLSSEELDTKPFAFGIAAVT
jgi:hypothetical protein